MMGRVADTLHKWKERPGGGRAAAGAPGGDKKLAEVKAVLERLHRISAVPGEDAPFPRHAESTGSGIAVLSRKAAAIRKEATPPPQLLLPPPRRRRSHLLASTASAVLLVGLGSAAIWWARGLPYPSDRALNLTLGKEHSVPSHLPPAKEIHNATALPSVPRPAKPDSEGSQLAEAEKLMDGGKILAARRILIGDFAASSPDAALMLARSYDPNFLRTLTEADAIPDIAEAERWYRTWHTNAAAKGLSMEPERLDRIIRAMR